jgi:hypothetical protein
MNNLEHKELVEKYLDGEMSFQEKLHFEGELKRNEQLASELAYYRLAHSAIIKNKLSTVHENVQLARKEYEAAQRKQKLYKTSALAILAILGISVCGYFTFFFSETKSGNKPPVIVSDSSTSVLQENKTGKISDKQNVSKSLGSEELPSPRINVSTTSENALVPIKNVDSQVRNEKNVLAKDSVQAKQASVPNLNQQSTDPCLGITITFQLFEKESCIGKISGEISVAKCEGGTKPYSYALSNGEQNKRGVFLNVESGEYTIQAKDKYGCESQAKSVRIKAVHCQVDLYLDPSANSPVVFQAYPVSGILTIHDKGGNLLFKSTKAANSDFEWNGESENTKLAPGYYLFIIKYEDGTVQNGSVTILP